MKKRLKVAFVVNKFPAVSHTFIYNQIYALLDKGHDVHLFSYHQGCEKTRHQLLQKYGLLDKCTFYPWRRTDKLIFFLLYLLEGVARKSNMVSEKSLVQLHDWRLVQEFALAKAENWFSKKNRFDVIHVHFGYNGIPIAKHKANGNLPKTKLVTTFHGFDIAPHKTQHYRIVYKNIFEHSDTLTVNTPYLKSVLLSVYNKHPSIHVLPMGVNNEFISPGFKKPKNVRSPVFMLLFCGRLVALKGPTLAVEIVNELVNNRNKNSILLRIIGEGPEGKTLLRAISKHNLEDHIALLGPLPQEKVLAEMIQSDALIMPGVKEDITGRAETQGLVVQEAQAVGLPVVVSDVGGMKHGLIHNKTGFVVKAGSVNAFADKVELLMNNPELKYNMGKEGRVFIKHNYSNDALVEKLIAIYKHE